MISIHALREEGDRRRSRPRSSPSAFLSTPSARRATPRNRSTGSRLRNFYPRPPRGGRPAIQRGGGLLLRISIHALREEGDRG